MRHPFTQRPLASLAVVRQGVTSVDVYDAVLYHSVRTRDAFERYLRDRGTVGDVPG